MLSMSYYGYFITPHTVSQSRVNNVSHYLMIYILISQFIMDISQYVIAFRVFAFFIFALIINKWKINYHLFIALNLIKRTVQAEIAFLNLLKNLKNEEFQSRDFLKFTVQKTISQFTIHNTHSC